MNEYEIDWKKPYEIPKSKTVIICETLDGTFFTEYISEKDEFDSWGENIIRWAYVDFSYKMFVMDYKHLIDSNRKLVKYSGKSENDAGLNSVGRSFLQAGAYKDYPNCNKSGEDPDDNSGSGDSMWPDDDSFMPEPISDEEVAAERESAKSFFEAFRKDIERYYANEEDDRK